MQRKELCILQRRIEKAEVTQVASKILRIHGRATDSCIVVCCRRELAHNGPELCKSIYGDRPFTVTSHPEPDMHPLWLLHGNHDRLRFGKAVDSSVPLVIIVKKKQARTIGLG
jgi:hypothetical protein